jgi:hypothetical protein
MRRGRLVEDVYVRPVLLLVFVELVMPNKMILSLLTCHWFAYYWMEYAWS